MRASIKENQNSLPNSEMVLLISLQPLAGTNSWRGSSRRKLHNSNLQKGQAISSRRDAVLAVPEVRELLEASGVKVKPYDYPYHRSIYSDDDVNVMMTNSDVRGVLNNIARRT